MSKCRFHNNHCRVSMNLSYLNNMFLLGIMAHFDVNVIVIARENSCKIGRAPFGVRLIFNNADRAPYDIVR